MTAEPVDVPVADETPLVDVLALVGPTEDGRPRLLSRGVYALYATPEGGLHLSYRIEGEDEDRHMPIPPMIIKLATAAQTGSGPLGMLKHLVPGA
jgi:hypothetical protein